MSFFLIFLEGYCYAEQFIFQNYRIFQNETLLDFSLPPSMNTNALF